jgi:hypothetical protein
MLWWRRFESSGMTAQAMRVDGEEPFGSGLERFWSPTFGNLLAKSMWCLWICPAGRDLMVRTKNS